MSTFSHRFALLILGLFAALTLGGCSSFDQQWKSPQPLTSWQSGQPLPGRWEGQWMSDSGHSGKLRAIITPTQAPSSATGSVGESYVANFQATFLGVLKGDYSVDLVATPGASTKFRGNKDLGWLAGGTYTYEGEASKGQFTARYSSPEDHGTFTMKRVGFDPFPSSNK